MDPLQAQFEQGVGDRFAAWLSSTSGEPCTFLRRADRAPDLVYFFKRFELLVEVTAVYYDHEHAAFLWKGARDAPDAPDRWAGESPHESLAAAIRSRIFDKSKKRYGSNTVLLIEVPPGLTTAERLMSLVERQPHTAETPFVGIYVVGTFPISTYSAGGYRVLPIKSMKQHEA